MEGGGPTFNDKLKSYIDRIVWSGKFWCSVKGENVLLKPYQSHEQEKEIVESF